MKLSDPIKKIKKKKEKKLFVISKLNERRDIEDNQLVIFDMKNISRGCVVRR